MLSSIAGVRAPRASMRSLAPLLIVALLMSAAWAATPAADGADAFRLEARARAAAALAQRGQPADALVQLDRASQGPLVALPNGLRHDLTTLLDELRSAVAAGDARAASTAADRIAARVQRSLPATLAAPDARTLIAELVRDAGNEGREGAAGGGIEPAAYASALATSAVDLADRRGLTETVRGALKTLAASLRGNVDASVVASSADNALAALGAPLGAGGDARAFQAITADLDLAQQRYAAGDAAGAEEALIDAYLEHFEDLEPPLQAAAPDLKDRLEHTLRDHLRSMVRSGASQAAFQSALTAARAELGQAQEALR